MFKNILNILFLSFAFFAASIAIQYPAGVRYNGIPASDFTVCYIAPYSSFTKSSDLQNCCNQFPVLLVAGQSSSSTSSYLLGAYGASSTICSPTTLNSPVQSNGVYWYFKTGSSSGFAASGTINQNSADVMSGADRLSWHLDQNVGGYRIGDTTSLNSNGVYYKVIYGYNPTNVSFPSLVPTVRPTVIPTTVGESTVQPTLRPTVSPTVRPSVTPTQSPTNFHFTDDILPRGVQFNSIPANDFTVCYIAAYSSLTKSSDLQNCCNQFPVLLVAGQSSSSTSSYLLGAYGASSTICSPTALNSPVQSNGVYWYFKTGSSSGFAASGTINQNSADTLSGPDRLSWHLDQGVGGYRIGDITGLNNNGLYYKVIYGYNPTNVSFPSLVPITTPTAIPSRQPTFRLPTVQPTVRPTVSPTARPSLIPTTSPTPRPSIAPTQSPTYMQFAGGLFPGGVQYNSIPASDFTVCYIAPYSGGTKASDLQNCCNQFPVLLVAGQSSSSTSSFLLGAYGLSSAICSPTAMNSPVQSNGVYWYFKAGSSSGFAASGSIYQSSADTLSGADRLSWHLDQNVGGYRIGDITSLNSNSAYYKVIYGYNPTNVSFPSLVPTVRPTAIPSRQPTVRVSTVQPTVRPTVSPSARPSVIPTTFPTVRPSTIPITAAPFAEGIIPVGVQYNSIPAGDFTVCYIAPYNAFTKSSDLQNCCNQFPVLLVAGQSSSSTSSYLLGAYGSSNIICSPTALNSPVESNGVYWYFTSGSSSGFAASGTISQSSADVMSGSDRLSWHLDQNVGGYRIGDTMGLNSNGLYYKVIYGYNPTNVSFPSLAPITTPTVIPTRQPTVRMPTVRPTLRPTVSPTVRQSLIPNTLPTSAPFAEGIIPAGVQYNSIPASNFTVCYIAPYSSFTKSSDLQNCCNQFPVLLVAGQSSSSTSSYLLGAYGSSNIICSPTTLNSPVESNGVYWYFKTAMSSGFAASGSITQSSADTVSGADRLSWHLDQNVGGYRIGDIMGLNSNGLYYKVIYGYNPTNVSFPSTAPTRFPTLTPSSYNSATIKPTVRPSISPSRMPSRFPTIPPTIAPTRVPTVTTTFFDVNVNMMVQNVSDLRSVALSDNGTIVLRSSLSQATNVPLSSIHFQSLSNSSSASRRLLSRTWRTSSGQYNAYFLFMLSLSTTGGVSKANDITNHLQQKLSIIANNGTLSNIIQKTSQSYGNTQFQGVAVSSVALSAPVIHTSSPTKAPTLYSQGDDKTNAGAFSFGSLGYEISLIIVIIGGLLVLFASCFVGYICAYYLCGISRRRRPQTAEIVGDIEMPVIDLDLIVEIPPEYIQPSAPPLMLEVETISWEEEIMQSVQYTWQSGDPAVFALHTILQLTDSWSSELIIGAGRFGKVYRHHPACFPTQHFPTGLCGLAIKHIDTSITITDPSNQAHANITPWNSLLREIKILSSFRHPNIIRLLGYCCEDIVQQDAGGESKVSQQLCLVYELGAVGDLHQCLLQEATRSSLPWTVRIRIALGIVSALNFLHCHKPGHPAYHRDIKSANIVLTADYTPKLIDCGLAKYEATEEEKARGFGMTLGNTILGQRFGSIGYMCPHYAKSGNYDMKSEIYSFGIVLLELLTGTVQGVIDPTTGQRQFLEDEILMTESGSTAEEGKDEQHQGGLHVDPLAGTWETSCATQLLEIGRQCVTYYAKRIDKMVTILRWLRQLEDMYCHNTTGIADESTLAVSEQVEQLRLQWEEEMARTNAIEEKIRQENALHTATHTEEEPSAPIAPPTPTTILRECCVCFDDVMLPTSAASSAVTDPSSTVTVGGGVECSSKAHHFLCKGCFHEQFQTQMHPVHRSTFTARRGKIVCIFCFTAYPEGLIATHTPLDGYAKYRQLCQEIASN